jgi:hypothetical protein
VVEPSRAGLVAASPDAPPQVVVFGQVAAGDQVEQAFDLGDGERDQPRLSGWWLVGSGRQRRRSPVAGGEDLRLHGHARRGHEPMLSGRADTGRTGPATSETTSKDTTGEQEAQVGRRKASAITRSTGLRRQERRFESCRGHHA